MESGPRTFASPRDVAKLLQSLIELNIDGLRSLRQAAAQFSNTGLRHVFQDAADAHGGFARELQDMVAELGETPTQTGTAAGDIYRWWMGLSGKIAEGDESAMLAEAERNERATRRRYEEVMEQLPPALELPPHEAARTPRKVREIEVRILNDAGVVSGPDVHDGPLPRVMIADWLSSRAGPDRDQNHVPGLRSSETIRSLLERHHKAIRRMSDTNTALRRTTAIA